MTAVEVLADPGALAERVADWLVTLSTATDAPFSISLSGGSTPQRLYQTLAQAPYCDRFPWARVHWFWGDERYVSADDPLSNYRMVRESLLVAGLAPRENIHPIRTDNPTPEVTALAYEQELITFYGSAVLDPERPLFDVTLLGLGTDGHTASLFPGTAVLQEKDRWVAAVRAAKPEPRITLTYPALNSSREVAFLVAGADKRSVLEEILSGTSTDPAARVQPVGNLRWFVDRAAFPG
ncbi:6-phosphogluconolactonase [Anthocerotibacter panamensis]|uniref:6-phosphogluconolactonase n=1 Tax=Anthocerotibacter panamensis TaxID=2857077 RepID=UPI001C4038C7|nr:6-phosphogluconolactonase [Anthocerotibacter panamensis]